MVLMFLLVVTGCGDQKADSQSNMDDLVKEAEQAKEDVEEMYGSQEYKWPGEADVLGVPELKKGKIVGLGITDKAVSVGYEGLTRDDIEAYKELLIKEGFVEGIEYPGGSIWNYVKNESDGAIEVTIAFGAEDGAASIVINPEGTMAAVSDQTSGDLSWPDGIPKDVPEFQKGTIINANDNYGVITVEFKDVKKADFESYKKTLTDAGFTYDEADSSDFSSQFEKVDQAKMSIVIVTVDYKDGYMTISAAGI